MGLKEEILKLRLDYLNTFITLVKTQNFSECARVLGKTQGTISQQLNELEKALSSERVSITLIERTSKKFELTPAGKSFYQISTQIIDEINHAVADVEKIAGQETFKIKIASSSIPGEYILPKIFTGYQSHHPNIEFSVTIANTKQAIEDLKYNRVNIAAVGSLQEVEGEEYEHCFIGGDEIMILAREQHPLFNTLSKMNPSGKNQEKMRSQLLEELMNYPWVFREVGSATRETFLLAFPHEDKIKIALEFHNNIAIINAIENSDALTALSTLILPMLGASNNIKPIINELIPKVERKFYVLRSKTRSFSPAEEQFWEYLKSWRH